MTRVIKLIDAPIGLFEVDGVLVLKTEYSTRHEDGTITPDCYIIESGEYFWGGVDSVEERNNLEVVPVNMPTLTSLNEVLTLEQLRKMDGEPVYVHNLFPAKRKFEWQWALVCKERGNAEATTYTYRFLDYGKTWIAYRRPLEGEAENEKLR